MTTAALVVLASALVLTVVSVVLKRADDTEPAETLREWLGLEEGEEL